MLRVIDGKQLVHSFPLFAHLDDATAKADVLPLSARRPNLPENFAPPPTSSVSNDSVKTEASCTTSEEGKKADTKADNEDVPSSEEVLSRLQSTLEECQDQLKVSNVNCGITPNWWILQESMMWQYKMICHGQGHFIGLLYQHTG